MQVMDETLDTTTPHKFYDCIESCFECAMSCWICADACLNEKEHAHLKECINLCLHNAEVCASTARVLASQPEQNEALIKLKECLEICHACMLECQKHMSQHEHCQIAAKCCEFCFNISSRALSGYLK